MMKSVHCDPRRSAASRHPADDGARWVVAAGLRRASAVLAAMAWRLVHAAPRPGRDAQFEFHAGADGVEGALYFDGKLVGWIEGVNRL